MDRLTIPALGVARDDALEELLRLEDEDFVRAAYQCLLGRVPADAELPSWLARLRGGGAAKVEVLASIRRSAEGRARGVHIPGLATAELASRARRVPIVGHLVRWVQEVLTRPDLAPRLITQEAAFDACWRRLIPRYGAKPE